MSFTDYIFYFNILCYIYFLQKNESIISLFSNITRQHKVIKNANSIKNMLGKQFNENFIGEEFYLLTNASELDGNFHYVAELFACNDIYYRYVIVPDDAIVIIYEKKFVASSLILGNQQFIFDDKDLCKQLVSFCGIYLKYTEYQTPELCLLAVKQYPKALRYVKYKDYDICKIALTEDLEPIKYIDSHSKNYEKLCEMVLNEDGLCLQYITKQTPHLYEIAVNQYVLNKTPQICLMAVKITDMH